MGVQRPRAQRKQRHRVTFRRSVWLTQVQGTVVGHEDVRGSRQSPEGSVGPLGSLRAFNGRVM